MANYGFYITARDGSTENMVFRVNINEWHELLFTLCPNFAASTLKFQFNREDVLSEEEIELLEKISFDEDAVSISEEYEEYTAPNFESALKWLTIFKKVELEYFKTEKEGFIHGIRNAENDETGIFRIIQKIRSSQFHFDQIKQTLVIAKENNWEIAVTISDY